MDDYSKGVVFYLNDSGGKVVGVLTWNLFGKMSLAKQVQLDPHPSPRLTCIWHIRHTIIAWISCDLYEQIIAEGKTEGDIGSLAAKFEIHPKETEV